MPAGKAVRKAGLSKQVFDLKNCGPRNRFVVRGKTGDLLVVHNCTQAVARDILQEGLRAADCEGFEIVGHVHDEIITLVDENDAEAHARLSEIMSRPIAWAPGLPLAAAGYVSKFYKKD